MFVSNVIHNTILIVLFRYQYLLCLIAESYNIFAEQKLEKGYIYTWMKQWP